MGQWGRDSTFTDNDVYPGCAIRVIAHVKTQGPFVKAKPTDLVDSLILLDVTGHWDKGFALFDRVSAEYVGQPLRKWMERVT